jgi:hypothetical protein
MKLRMVVYWVVRYNVLPGKGNSWIDFLKSDEAKRLIENVEKELGIKYIGDFGSVAGGGNFDFEEWWELPNFATFDKWRDSKALHEWVDKVYQMVDTPGGKIQLYEPLTEARQYEPRN